MEIKYYKNASNEIYGYPIDGSQDHLIGDKVSITQSELDTILENNRQTKFNNLSYVVKRQAHYPDPAVFLDAWVKNDTEALEAYRQSCLAVKAQFPKN